MLEQIPVGPPCQRHAVSGARRQQLGHRRPREPVDLRRQRPRQPVRHRRRQRHQPGLRRPRVLLDHLRIARQRDAVRLRQGNPGQDRRLRSRVRPGDRRRRQRHHQERLERVPRIGVRLRAARQARRRLDAVSRRPTAAVNTVGTHDQRRRRRGRRSDRQGSPVLLRRDRSVAGRRARSPRPPDFPLASLGDVDRERRTTSYAAKATVPAEQRAPHRRVVLRRSVERRRSGRSGPRRCCVDRHVRRSARSTTAATSRPSATTASSRAELAASKASFARALNDISELPVGRHLARHRSDGDAERHHRRHRLLRAGQPTA